MFTGRQGVADCDLAGDTGSDPGVVLRRAVRDRLGPPSPPGPGLWRPFPSTPCVPCQASSRCSELPSSTEVGLISIVCPRRVCRPGEPTASLDANTDEAGHCAEQGRGPWAGEQWPRRRRAAQGGRREGCGQFTKSLGRGAGNRQCSWTPGCPAGVQRRSTLSWTVSSVTNAGKREAGQGDGEREPEQQSSLVSHERCEATETVWLVNDSDGRHSPVTSASF